MLKLKMIINSLLAVTILFFYHSVDPLTAYGLDYSKGSEDVIVDQCPRENSRQGDVGGSTLSGNQEYPSNWSCKQDSNVKYDKVNSAQTIEQNGSAMLIAIGNNGPFTWSVSENGFWFDSAYSKKSIQTKGTSVTIYANSSACGAATITVAGCNGNPDTGYVRCTTGGWGPQQTGCILPGAPDSEACGSYANYKCTYTKVSGKYRQVQQVGADPYCNNSEYRTQCLDYDCGHILQNNNWQNCEPFTCCWQGGTTYQFCLFNFFIYYQEWQCNP